MNWKSTAVVSGATVLAGWLVSAPPKPASSSSVAASTQRPQTNEAGAEIGDLAAHLQARRRQDPAYGQPERNLFRFGPNAPARSALRASGVSIAEVPPRVETVALPPPPVSLSGVASDPDGQRTVRTAILSSPAGVLLVHEGEEVMGQFRVGVIGEDSVELTRLSDGTTLRLALR